MENGGECDQVNRIYDVETSATQWILCSFVYEKRMKGETNTKMIFVEKVCVVVWYDIIFFL